MNIPVYIFTGWLESGKTTLVQSTLEDPAFNNGEKTLLIGLEEGSVEYDRKRLKYLNTHLEMLKEPDLEKFRELDGHYLPERVMIEYNGARPVTELLKARLPERWEIAQIVATVDASTYESFLANLRSFMYEQLRYAELVIFNRCSAAVKKSMLRGSVRAFNRSAQIIFEDMDGQVSEFTAADLPFDLSGEEIAIGDKDYGIWYIDALDHPRKYEGKILSFTAQAFPTVQFGKPIVAVGRYSMVCCDKDKAFLGIGIIDQDGKGIRAGEWVKASGRVRIDYDQASGQDYISLCQSTLAPAAAPDEANVGF